MVDGDVMPVDGDMMVVDGDLTVSNDDLIVGDGSFFGGDLVVCGMEMEGDGERYVDDVFRLDGESVGVKLVESLVKQFRSSPELE